MARFDVYRRRGAAGYLLDCQSDLLAGLNTRFVVPLLSVEEAPPPAARLNPVLTVEGVGQVMVTQFAAAVMKTELGERVASQAEHADRIVGALDVLITGV